MRKRAEMATRLAIVLISLPMTACGSDQPPAETETVAQASDDLTWGRAIVTGDVSVLTVFEQQLKTVLGDPNLEAQLIRCSEGCDKLSDSPPPTRLVYFFSREHLATFANAWHATQTSEGDPEFSLQIDANVPPPDCPVKVGCQGLPNCSDGCGKRGPPVNCNFC